MTAPTARIGLGATITFLSTGCELEVTKAKMSAVTRSSHETTHLGTAQAGVGNHGSRTYIPGNVVDPGSMDVEGHWNGAVMELIEASTQRARITMPVEAGNVTGESVEVDAFLTSIGETDLGPDDKIMVSFTAKFSGERNYVPAM